MPGFNICQWFEFPVPDNRDEKDYDEQEGNISALYK